MSKPKISRLLMQRVINDVKWGETYTFSQLCVEVAGTPWGMERELTPTDVRFLVKKNIIVTEAEQPEPVSFANISRRLDGPVPRPLCVCYGMGVDSTALLIRLAQLFHETGNSAYRPDIITFADTGNEKKETYAYGKVIQAFLKRVGFPPLVTVRYKPSPKRVKHGMYHTLEQNCLTNATLPSLAFGYKKCSAKWKRNPQDKHRESQEICQDAWAAGLQVIVAIGYDAGPKDQRRADIEDDEQYEYWYPLIHLGWDREECIRQIQKEGLPGWADWRGLKWVRKGGQPVKSACWFCPSTKQEELHNFANTKHGRDYLRGIIRMEDTAQPFLTTIDGLWRNGVKGTRTGKPRPGRMADYIKQQKLLNGEPALPVLQQGNHGFTGCEECVGCF